MKFIDTIFLIDIRRKNPTVNDILTQLDKEGIHAVSSLVAHEFLVGGYGSKSKNELKERKKLLQHFIIFPFDEEAAHYSAQIESDLRKRGQLIGIADTMIAGTMKSHGIDTIVTRNKKYFDKINGIKVLSWK